MAEDVRGARDAMTAMEQTVPAVRPYARRELVPSGLFGMVIFVGTEIMFFAGLISAFTISKAGAPEGAWDLPAGQVLPRASTAIYSMALFASGALLSVAGRQYRAQSSAAAPTLLAATVLGALFVLFQGSEWVALIGGGVTLWSSALGAFIYVIVGTHAVHAVAALTALGLPHRTLAQAGKLVINTYGGRWEKFWRSDLVPAFTKATKVEPKDAGAQPAPQSGKSYVATPKKEGEAAPASPTTPERARELSRRPEIAIEFVAKTEVRTDPSLMPEAPAFAVKRNNPLPIGSSRVGVSRFAPCGLMITRRLFISPTCDSPPRPR